MSILTRRRRWVLALVAGGVFAAATYAAVAATGRGRGSPARPGSPAVAPPVPVVAVSARASDVAVYLTGLGAVTPLNTVTVHTRVDGQLMSVKFQEGQLVHRGDLLAEIDPRPFEVQLAQAQGQLIHDQALLENARLDLQRYQVLIEQDSIPRQQLDTQASLVRQLEGTVKTDQAQIDNARLQLVYCHVTSPILRRERGDLSPDGPLRVSGRGGQPGGAAHPGGGSSSAE